ncbi:MAG: undecaprenyl-diphosphate phosphatase [Alphaproteobacteria bacterium]|nr:undecaprenyl-diphosphate phosphatase [Alphaproteobacteria bacterium]
MTLLLTALFLGFIEGLTEFIPVSSTGHLVILTEYLNFPAPPGHVFEVFIQLGAILAVIVQYREKLISTALNIPHSKPARNFTIGLAIATLPAICVGALFHDTIKSLYTPPLIGSTLLLGGIIILLLEKRLTKSAINNIDAVPLKTAFLIGCFQALALIPGVSRSGATIMGALFLGMERKTAAEFSFFLAIPVMIGAVLYDTYKNYDALLRYPDLYLLFAGFAAAFVTALFTLKFAMHIIARHGFAPFAWYRIAAGFIVLLFFIT